MKTYFELKTLSGNEFRGWMQFKVVHEGFMAVTRQDDSEVIVPIPQVACLEELPEGHKCIPQWAVDQLAEKEGS